MVMLMQSRTLRKMNAFRTVAFLFAIILRGEAIEDSVFPSSSATLPKESPMLTSQQLLTSISNFNSSTFDTTPTTMSTFLPLDTTPTTTPFTTTTSSTNTTTFSTTPSTTSITTTNYPTTISSSTPATTIPTTPTPIHPNPAPSTWVVVDEKSNVTCIVIKLGASFIIPYMTHKGQVVNSTFALPANATANGTCSMNVSGNSHAQAISLQWSNINEELNQNMLTLVFKKNFSRVSEAPSLNENYFISDVFADIYPDSINFPDSANDSYLYSRIVDASMFPVGVNSSYRCNAQEFLELKADNNEHAFVSVANLQVEAFRSQPNEKFSSAVDCSADKIITSDIVPIAVGCALAALVVIVLVAYLIGRRRARQRGYQSV